MPDYQKGKIYKITSGDLTYIGSTIQATLARRLSEHVCKFKRFQDGKERITTSFQLIETGTYEITLIELYPCRSKDELHARERFHIENTVCVNKRIPNRTRKENYYLNHELNLEKQKAYDDINANIISEKKKSYYEANKEIILEKSKARYQAKKDLQNKI